MPLANPDVAMYRRRGSKISVDIRVDDLKLDMREGTTTRQTSPAVVQSANPCGEFAGVPQKNGGVGARL
jgi:hypothetical protein